MPNLIPSYYAKRCLSGCSRLNLNIDIILLSAGLDRRKVFHPEEKITETQLINLLREIWLQSNDEFMGFTPNRCKVGVFNLMLQHCQQHQTLISFLTNAFQFYYLVNDDLNITLTTKDDQAIIQSRLTSTEHDKKNFFIESWQLTWYRLICWLTGERIPLIAVKFTHPKPSHSDLYKYMYPCSIEFDCKHNEILLDPHHLNKRIIRNHHDYRYLIKTTPTPLFKIDEADKAYETRIIKLINPSTNVFRPLSFNHIAKKLGTSPQTLRRRLNREGTHYAKIKEQVREDCAKELLRNKGHSIQKIALLLGFSESSAFSKAFKAWTGLSPTHYVQSFENQFTKKHETTH